MLKLPPWLLRWTATGDPAATGDHILVDVQRGIVLHPNAVSGSITGPPLAVNCWRVVPSWWATTPPGTSIAVELRANIAGAWTRWYALGVWADDQAQRHSVAGQRDDLARVATDTLILAQPAQAIQWRVVLHGADGVSPALHEIALAPGPVSAEDQATPAFQAVGPLPAPQLSQMSYAGGGPVWCSPTALTMILAYWHAQTGDPAVARFTAPDVVPEIVAPAVYDAVYDGAGNWSFNVAYAATFGLASYVVQLGGLNQVADYLHENVPLVASVAWQEGELDGAPIAQSDGHLVVIVGLTEQGDVIVNDPRADVRAGEFVQRVYRRDQFLRAWERSGRTVYLICPRSLIA